MFFHHFVRVPPFYKMFSLHAPMLRIINFTQLLHCTLEDSKKNRDGLFVLGYVTIFQQNKKKFVTMITRCTVQNCCGKTFYYTVL